MKNFSKVLLMTIFGSLIYSSPAKADWDYWAVNNLSVYTCVSSSGECTLRSTLTPDEGNYFYGQYNYHYVDNENNIILYTSDGNVNSYSLDSNKWTRISSDQWRTNYQTIQKRRNIEKGSDGTFSIGENSLKLKETATAQEMWATNSSGSIAPINITNGSKLLIDGVEVIAGDSPQVTTNKNNIKNLGEGVAGSTALTAALTALPQTSTKSKLSCGVGTGAYSSRYAISFGCASKVNERVDLNAGGSYVLGGSKSYGGGTLDSGVVKAGFVFKLGELSKPTKISFNDKKIIDKKLSTLEENNKNLNAELKLSKAKNDEIISQNQKLLKRLEKLENITLKFQSSPEMISVVTKE